MSQLKKAIKLIEDSKNVSIFPYGDEKSEIIPLSLALLYSLRKIGKNVNLLIEEMPEKFKFLIPSLDFISYPRNFLLSIPKKNAEVSQIRYEKNGEGLKIYFTLEKGNLKKDSLLLNVINPLPDLLINLGAKDQKHLKQFFPEKSLNCPILNIHSLTSKKSSIVETVFNFIKSINENLFNKEISTPLLTSLIIFSENFQNQNTTPALFEIAAFLAKQGASPKEIVNYLYKNNQPLKKGEVC